MAFTLEDFDRMIDAAERAGVVLIVGHTASFNPGLQKIGSSSPLVKRVRSA